MLRSHPGPTSRRRTETRSRPPCARSIFRPSRRSKTDTPAPGQRARRRTKAKPTEFSFSCDDPQSFHFPIEPDPIDDQRYSGHKRCDCPCEINRRAFYEIDPDAPQSDSQREKRRENNENNMKTFKRHLVKDRVVVPR